MEKNTHLGFLSLEETRNKDGYIGAILVTDLQSVPLEFRCTHPVKPTLIQKPLYGESLKPFIGNELCGGPLIKSLQNKPSCIVVNIDFLLNLRPDISIPTVFAKRAGEVIEVDSRHKQTSPLPRKRVESPTGKFQPIILVAHSDYKDDFDKLKSLLGDSSKGLDLVEPFTRIKTALKVLAEQDSKFQ